MSRRKGGRPRSIPRGNQPKPAFDPLTVPCPTCGQDPGLDCVSILDGPTHGRTRPPHLDRLDDAVTF